MTNHCLHLCLWPRSSNFIKSSDISRPHLILFFILSFLLTFSMYTFTLSHLMLNSETIHVLVFSLFIIFSLSLLVFTCFNICGLLSFIDFGIFSISLKSKLSLLSSYKVHIIHYIFFLILPHTHAHTKHIYILFMNVLIFFCYSLGNF